VYNSRSHSNLIQGHSLHQGRPTSFLQCHQLSLELRPPAYLSIPFPVPTFHTRHFSAKSLAIRNLESTDPRDLYPLAYTTVLLLCISSLAIYTHSQRDKKEASIIKPVDQLRDRSRSRTPVPIASLPRRELSEPSVSATVSPGTIPDSTVALLQKNCTMGKRKTNTSRSSNASSRYPRTAGTAKQISPFIASARDFIRLQERAMIASDPTAHFDDYVQIVAAAVPPTKNKDDDPFKLKMSRLSKMA
jgi:hypothetical protein